MSKIKLTIIFTVLMDVIGIGVVIPSLVFHVQQLGGSEVAVTSLFAVFSLCAFFSSPFLGSLSDRIGRRPVLLISIFSTAIGWYVFAAATTVWLLFLGRIIDGLAAGNFSTAQSYLSDLAKDEKERTTNLGLIGGMFGLGFVIGPLLGGLLGGISPEAPFWFTAILATINLLFAYKFLPESLQHKKESKIEFNPFKPLVRAVKNKVLLPFYFVWLLFGLTTSGFQSIVALIFDDVYHFNSLVIGLIISGQGMLMALNQMIGLKQFWLKKFKASALTINFLLFFTLAYFALAFKPMLIFAFGYFLLVFLQPVWRVVLTSEVLGKVSHSDKGEVVGVMAAVVSLGMIIGPMIAGPLRSWNSYSFFFVSAILTFISYLVLRFFSVKIDKIKEEEIVNVIG